MLQSIRDRAHGWLAWTIIGIIIIPFALWGIQEYVGGDADVEVASVAGTKISQQDFQRDYEQQRERMRSLLGDNSASLDEANIKQSVLNSLITEQVLHQSTDELGLRISNAQLAGQIQSMPEFQENGQFSKAVFVEQLRRIGLTPEGFEARVRQGLLADQLNAGITSMSLVTQSELDEAIRIKNQQREIGYLILPWENFKKDVAIDEAAVKKYYDEHRKNLVNPEQLSIEYIELSASDLAKSIKPDDAELRKLYEEQRAGFAVEEQRRASQILIVPAKEADPAALASASAKADDLYKRLQAKGDFAQLAKENSHDKATAAAGGDLGFVSKGTLDPAVEQALYALKPGEMSKPVKTPAGLHILKLTEIKPAYTKTFEEVRAALEKDALQRKAQDLFFEKSESLTNLVYENPDTLAIAAKELGLPIKTSGLFSRQGGADEIARHAKVINAAFSDEMLGRGYNSEPIDLGENHLVVLRVKEHKEASERTLEQVHQTISERLLMSAAQAKARAAGVAIQKRLSQGEDPLVIAKEYKTAWVKPGLIGREDAGVKNPAIVKAAFALPKPAKNANKSLPEAGGEPLPSGDFAVIALYSVKEGSPAAMEASARLALRRELQRAKAESEYQNFVNELKAETKIVIQQDNL